MAVRRGWRRRRTGRPGGDVGGEGVQVRVAPRREHLADPQVELVLGYLSKSGADVTWGSPVPLGQPFSVRDPLWDWGTGRTLTNGDSDSSAIPTIVAGLFFDGLTLLLLYVLIVVVRDTSGSPRRSQRMPVPAPADPGGVHRTHHPDRGHHGNGVRRARRRRGRR
jgi:hypothetical protein